MNPKEYAEICESFYITPPGQDRGEYLAFLLNEEAGEVSKIFAKAMRDGATHPNKRHVYGFAAIDKNKLIKELGDVLWCVSFHDDDPADWFQVPPPDEVSNAFVLEMLNEIANAPTMATMSNLCSHLGLDVRFVALANIEKLKSRRDRGTLNGEGDDR